MPFISIADRGLRVFVRINDSTDKDDHLPPQQFLDGAKPNLVMVHATLSSSYSFKEQFKDMRLLKSFNLIALDLRFCGRTESEPREDFSMRENALDLGATINALGLGSVSLVSQGALGANVVTWLTIFSPALVKCVVLCSPGALEVKPETRNVMLEDWLPLALANKDGNGDQTGTLNEESMDVVEEFFFGHVAGRNLARRDACLTQIQKRYGPGRDSSDLLRVASYFLRPMIPLNLRENVTAPVLILQGSEDEWSSPMRAAQSWKDGFTSAWMGTEIKVVQGAPHLLCFFSPQEASREIRAFVLKSLSPTI